MTPSIELCWVGMPLLAIAAVSAVIAYLGDSRAMFVCAVVGLLASRLIPEPRVYAHYANGEAAMIAGLRDSMAHAAMCGLLGAGAGLLVGRYVFPDSRPPSKNEPDDQT
jgi:hypothetical protein